MSSASTLTIGVVMPEVFGSYGDSGNATVLAKRAELRGIAAEVVRVGVEQAIPESLDIYTLGGSEDVSQNIAAHRLAQDAGLHGAVDAGRPVLAVCAGLQVLGNWYVDGKGQQVSGTGLLDVVTLPLAQRAVGELRCVPGPDLVNQGVTELLTGFENHGGGTLLGSDAQPLGFVSAGVGNGVRVGDRDGSSEPGGDTTAAFFSLPAHNAHAYASVFNQYQGLFDGKPVDGVVQGSVYATYMHGPVLARNPQLADMLLARALGVSVGDLAPIEVPGLAEWRAQRTQN
ncbi:MAG: glutamine amidotransferase [Actinomycetaceae bacterium]|nr:glutamine amidotransferase [Actinomycetaceae bacterium]